VIDAIQRLTFDALRHAVLDQGDDADAAAAELLKLEPGGQALFSATCGWAAIVAEVALNLCPGGRPLAGDVEALPGGGLDQVEVDTAENAIALIVAVGNHDHDGALTLWEHCHGQRACDMAMVVLGLAAAVVRPVER
jgi:hypothetical protein